MLVSSENITRNSDVAAALLAATNRAAVISVKILTDDDVRSIRLPNDLNINVDALIGQPQFKIGEIRVTKVPMDTDNGLMNGAIVDDTIHGNAIYLPSQDSQELQSLLAEKAKV